jgi:hypothetical protein
MNCGTANVDRSPTIATTIMISSSVKAAVVVRFMASRVAVAVWSPSQ